MAKKAYRPKPTEISLVRVCLDGPCLWPPNGEGKENSTPGHVTFFGWRKANDDYDITPLDPLAALRLITQGQVEVEIACNDPDDKKPHNYEGRIAHLDYI